MSCVERHGFTGVDRTRQRQAIMIQFDFAGPTI